MHRRSSDLDPQKLPFWRRAALLLALIALMGIVGGMDARDAEIAAKAESVAAAQKAETYACIAQYAASERWLRHAAVYECARGGELPNHVLTNPVAEAR